MQASCARKPQGRNGGRVGSGQQQVDITTDIDLLVDKAFVLSNKSTRTPS